MQYVMFSVGGVEFGAPMDQVREVAVLPPVTPLPGAPDFIEGLINLRGHNLALINLRRWFRMPTESQVSGDEVMVVRVKTIILGVIVDAVTNVTELDPRRIDPAPNVLGGHLEGQVVKGVCRVGDRIVVLIDFGEALNPQDRRVIEVLHRP